MSRAKGVRYRKWKHSLNRYRKLLGKKKKRGLMPTLVQKPPRIKRR